MNTDKNMDKDLLKIINFYGEKNQLKKLSEELYEFQESVIEHKFFNVLESKCHVIEELSDLFVLLMQFKEYYHIDGKEIMKIMREKIDRQLNRMSKEIKK